MAADIQNLRPYLQAFDLTGLMVEGLGWNHHQGEPTTVTAGGETYDLHPVAERPASPSIAVVRTLMAQFRPRAHVVRLKSRWPKPTMSI